MHEQSVAIAMLRQVDMIRRENAADRVSQIDVEIGPLAGIEPILLSNAFEQLADGAFLSAKLVIHPVPLEADCQACDTSFEIENYHFRCPQCDGNVRVTRGDELHIVSVTLQSNELSQELPT